MELIELAEEIALKVNKRFEKVRKPELLSLLFTEEIKNAEVPPEEALNVRQEAARIAAKLRVEKRRRKSS
jgi:hypothetical protein